MFLEQVANMSNISTKPYFKDNGFELYLDDCRNF
jgi:hypothetical protein